MTAATTWLYRASAIIRLARLPFLVGGFVFHALGAAIATYAGAPFDPRAFVWGQVVVTAAQLMTHFANEYFDLAADRANPTPTRWSGGSRVLLTGNLPPRVALAAALALGAVALGASLVLAWVVRTGVLTLPLLLLSMVLAWSYSGPPLRLQARGLGGLTAAVIVPGLTPVIGFYLQAGEIAPLPVLAVLPLCGLQFAMLLLIDIPDAAGDAAAGKRTLVVRFGPVRAMQLYSLTLLVTYAALPVLTLAGTPLLAVGAVMLDAPVALWLGWRVVRGDWRAPAHWEGLVFWSVALLIGTGVMELGAFLLMQGVV